MADTFLTYPLQIDEQLAAFAQRILWSSSEHVLEWEVLLELVFGGLRLHTSVLLHADLMLQVSGVLHQGTHQ